MSTPDETTVTGAPVDIRWLSAGEEALAARAIREVVEDGVHGIDAGWLADPRAHFLVALVDGEPAGVAYGHTLPLPDGRTEMLLYSLDVAARYRRRGIGRALVEAFVGRARALGFDEVWVLTDVDNDAGNATYRAAGGEPAPPSTMYTWR